MSERNNSLMFPVLALAVAGLGYANYRLLDFKVDVSPAFPAAAAAPGTGLAPKELSLAPPAHAIGEFPLTATRPVFFADRKVPEKPKPKPTVAEVKDVVAPPPSAPPPEPLQLVGIMGAGSSKRALVRTAADPQGTWLAIGDEYRGWQLREIATDNAIVEARGQRSELRLYAFGVAKPVKR